METRSRPPPRGLHLPPASAPPHFPEHPGPADHTPPPPPRPGPKSRLARARACGPGGAGRQPAARRALAPEVPAPAGSAPQGEGGGCGGHPLSTRPLGPGPRSCAGPRRARRSREAPRARTSDVAALALVQQAGGRAAHGRDAGGARRAALTAPVGARRSLLEVPATANRALQLKGKLPPTGAAFWGASSRSAPSEPLWAGPGAVLPPSPRWAAPRGRAVWEDFPLFPSCRLLLLLLTVMGRRETPSRKRATSLVTVNLCGLEPSPRTNPVALRNSSSQASPKNFVFC